MNTSATNRSTDYFVVTEIAEQLFVEVFSFDCLKAYFHYGCAALRFAAIVRDSDR